MGQERWRLVRPWRESKLVGRAASVIERYCREARWVRGVRGRLPPLTMVSLWREEQRRIKGPAFVSVLREVRFRNLENLF